MSDHAHTSTAHAVKSARLSAGFTQKELAEKTGLSQGYLSQIEVAERQALPARTWARHCADAESTAARYGMMRAAGTIAILICRSGLETASPCLAKDACFLKPCPSLDSARSRRAARRTQPHRPPKRHGTANATAPASRLELDAPFGPHGLQVRTLSERRSSGLSHARPIPHFTSTPGARAWLPALKSAGGAARACQRGFPSPRTTTRAR